MKTPRQELWEAINNYVALRVIKSSTYPFEGSKAAEVVIDRAMDEFRSEALTEGFSEGVYTAQEE